MRRTLTENKLERGFLGKDEESVASRTLELHVSELVRKCGDGDSR